MAKPPHRTAAPLSQVEPTVLRVRAYEYAKNLISNRQCVLDERSDWTDHRPARTAEGNLSSNMVLPNMRNGISAKTTRNRRATSAVQVSLWDFNSVHRCA